MRECQVGCGDNELHCLAFALLKEYLFESFQLFYRADNGTEFILNVQLHNLFSIIVASVADVACNGKFIVHAHLISRESHVSVRECGVALAITEGEEWSVAGIKEITCETE